MGLGLPGLRHRRLLCQPSTGGGGTPVLGSSRKNGVRRNSGTARGRTGEGAIRELGDTRQPGDGGIAPGRGEPPGPLSRESGEKEPLGPSKPLAFLSRNPECRDPLYSKDLQQPGEGGTAEPRSGETREEELQERFFFVRILSFRNFLGVNLGFLRGLLGSILTVWRVLD